MGGGKVSANDGYDVIISQSVARDAWRQNKMAAGCPEEEENVFMCA